MFETSNKELFSCRILRSNRYYQQKSKEKHALDAKIEVINYCANLAVWFI